MLFTLEYIMIFYLILESSEGDGTVGYLLYISDSYTCMGVVIS